MPIRINLLAEQQQAEEMRRRDPVKKALWIGGALVAVMILWSVNLQFKVGHARTEAATLEADYEDMKPQFLMASNTLAAGREIEARLADLERYQTNRFLWAPVLNELQFVAVDNVRVIEVKTTQTYTEDPRKIELTPKPLRVDLPEKSWWQWWTDPPKTNINDLVGAFLNTVTNKPEMARFQSMIRTTVAVTTNEVQHRATLQVLKPETVTELVRLTVKARDYSTARSGGLGSQYPKFFANLTNAPLFSMHLNKTNAYVQPESVQAKTDPKDPFMPSEPFIPFTIEYYFPEKIRVDE